MNFSVQHCIFQIHPKSSKTTGFFNFFDTNFITVYKPASNSTSKSSLYLFNYPESSRAEGQSCESRMDRASASMIVELLKGDNKERKQRSIHSDFPPISSAAVGFEQGTCLSLLCSVVSLMSPLPLPPPYPPPLPRRFRISHLGWGSGFFFERLLEPV